jgi:hypothetical protein
MRPIRINDTEYVVYKEQILPVKLDVYLVARDVAGDMKERWLPSRSFGQGQALLLAGMKIILWYDRVRINSRPIEEVTGENLNTPTEGDGPMTDPKYKGGPSFEEVKLRGEKKDIDQVESFLRTDFDFYCPNNLKSGCGRCVGNEYFLVFYKAYSLTKEEKDSVFQERQLEALQSRQAPPPPVSAVPVEAPKPDLTSELVNVSLDAIRRELDNAKIKRPTHYEVFMCLCSDRITLEKTVKKFGARSRRTISNRKHGLDAFLRRKFNLQVDDYLLADPSFFGNFEKLQSDRRARRIDPFEQVEKPDTDDED